MKKTRNKKNKKIKPEEKKMEYAAEETRKIMLSHKHGGAMVIAPFCLEPDVLSPDTLKYRRRVNTLKRKRGVEYRTNDTNKKEKTEKEKEKEKEMGKGLIGQAQLKLEMILPNGRRFPAAEITPVTSMMYIQCDPESQRWCVNTEQMLTYTKPFMGPTFKLPEKARLVATLIWVKKEEKDDEDGQPAIVEQLMEECELDLSHTRKRSETVVIEEPEYKIVLSAYEKVADENPLKKLADLGHANPFFRIEKIWSKKISEKLRQLHEAERMAVVV